MRPEFPRPTPSPCRACPPCTAPPNRNITSLSNPNGNARRPYYACSECNGWVCWDDDRDISDKNPLCHCSLFSRLNRRNDNSGDWLCCSVGECEFQMAAVDAGSYSARPGPSLDSREKVATLVPSATKTYKESASSPSGPLGNTAGESRPRHDHGARHVRRPIKDNIHAPAPPRLQPTVARKAFQGHETVPVIHFNPGPRGYIMFTTYS